MKTIKIYPSDQIEDRIVLYTVCEATPGDVKKSYTRKHHQRGQKRVFMYNSDNLFVGTFESIRKAANVMKIDQSNISKALDISTRSAGGYRWQTYQTINKRK